MLAAAYDLPNISCDEGGWTAAHHLQYDPGGFLPRISHVQVQIGRCCEEEDQHATQKEGGTVGQSSHLCHGDHP